MTYWPTLAAIWAAGIVFWTLVAGAEVAIGALVGWAWGLVHGRER